MNERFKFRVWDKAENKYNGFSFHLAMSGELDRLSVDGDLLETDEERFTIEQCTGLKDKNGKLIYEGDVVMFDTEGFEIRVGTVLFQASRFCVQWDNKLSTPLHALNDAVEIIGNVHEMGGE